jgi:hypothetical protein
LQFAWQGLIALRETPSNWRYFHRICRHIDIKKARMRAPAGAWLARPPGGADLTLISWFFSVTSRFFYHFHRIPIHPLGLDAGICLVNSAHFSTGNGHKHVVILHKEVARD